MADDLSAMRKSALLNNSYDKDSTHDELLDSFQNSYSYLYELQKSSVGYKEFHYYPDNEYDGHIDNTKSGHLYVLNGKVYVNIFYTAIHISGREAFYRNLKNPADSENISGGYSNNENYKTNMFYYKDEFTFDDMINNRDIFKKLPFLLIDDMPLYDYKIKFFKDHFRAEIPTAPGLTLLKYNNDNNNETIVSRSDSSPGIYYSKHKVQVLLMDNCLCRRYKSGTISPNNSTGHEHYMYYSNNIVKSVLKEPGTFAENGINPNDEYINDTGLVFAMVHLPNANKTYDFGVGLYPLMKYDNALNNASTRFYVPNWFVTKFNEIKNDIHSTRNPMITTFLYVKGAHLHNFTYFNSNASSNAPINSCYYCDKRGASNASIEDKKYDLLIPYKYSQNYTNAKYFNQPVPIENFMVIKSIYTQTTSGYVYNPTIVKNTDYIKLHYPNIYEIIDDEPSIANRYYIIYFYDENAKPSRRYTNEYDFFYKYLYSKWNSTELNEPRRIQATISGINNGSIKTTNIGDSAKYQAFKDDFDNFMNLSVYTGYNYYKYPYTDADYLSFIKEHNEYDNRSYDDIRFKDVTAHEPNALRDYVRRENKLYDYSYHMDISFAELEGRLRNSSENENVVNDETNEPYTFFNPHYVFTFSNKSTKRKNKTDLRIYVNGLYVGNFVQVRKNYRDYIYIPARYFNNGNNHIDLEVLPSYEHVSPLSFTALNQTKEITLLDPADGIYPTISDIYYMTPVKYIDQIKDESINAKDSDIVSSDVDVSLPFGDCVPPNRNIIRYDPSVIQVTAHCDGNNYELLPIANDHKYTKLKSFKITAKSESILNKTTWFRIAKIPHKIKYTVVDDGYQFIEIPERNFHFNPQYLRIFINGRLVPHTNYSYVSDHYYPRIHLFERCITSDEIYIDIAPYRYKQIAQFDSIDDYIVGNNIAGANKFAFINLSRYLQRPFDVENYDVFINGYKVSQNNMLSYNGTGLILFTSLTTSNLVIYEKERDTEYYPMFEQPFTYQDLFDGIYTSAVDKTALLDNYIITNKNQYSTYGDIINIIPGPEIFHNSDYQMIYIFYRTELIRKKFVSPDIRQFNKLFLEMDYPLIYNNYVETTDEMQHTSHGQNVLHLNPDKYIEGEEPPENVDPEEYEEVYKVYGVGHLYEDLDPSIEQAAIAGTNTPVIIFDPDLSFN